MTSQAKPVVLAQIVLFHSIETHGMGCVERGIRSVVDQQGFTLGETLQLLVCDNGSEDPRYGELQRVFADLQIEWRVNQYNLGFAGAHNQAAGELLRRSCDYLLVLNPDLRLEGDCLLRMVEALEEDRIAGFATPLLLRADEDLMPFDPPLVDAAGMYITPTLRHFDRTVAKEDLQGVRRCYVFGGSGACLLVRGECVRDLLLEGGDRECDVERIYPQLKENRAERALLFDEGFFAYREDADLAWRAQWLGWSTLFVAKARGYHRRVVLPEKRSSLAAGLNLLGVRNRFLLQLNNYSLVGGMRCLLPGVIIRNLIVVIAVVLVERSSLPAFRHLFLLFRRALARRRVLFSRKRVGGREVGRWFVWRV